MFTDRIFPRFRQDAAWFYLFSNCTSVHNSLVTLFVFKYLNKNKPPTHILTDKRKIRIIYKHIEIFKYARKLKQQHTTTLNKPLPSKIVNQKYLSTPIHEQFLFACLFGWLVGFGFFCLFLFCLFCLFLLLLDKVTNLQTTKSHLLDTQFFYNVCK